MDVTYSIGNQLGQIYMYICVDDMGIARVKEEEKDMRVTSVAKDPRGFWAHPLHPSGPGGCRRRLSRSLIFKTHAGEYSTTLQYTVDIGIVNLKTQSLA